MTFRTGLVNVLDLKVFSGKNNKFLNSEANSFNKNKGLFNSITELFNSIKLCLSEL